MSLPVYEVRLVEKDGTVITTWDAGAFTPETSTRTMNAPDECELSFPKGGDGVGLTSDDIDVLVTGGNLYELQVYDTANARGVFWGPVISITGSGDDGSIHVKCAGVDWYLMRRFLDGTVTQYLSNEQFESDFTDWTDQTGGTVGGGPSSTFVIDTDRVFLGEKSAKLAATGTGGGAFVSDQFVEQTVSITAGTLGLALVLSGWFYILPGTTYEPALEGRGLYVETRNGSTFVANNYYPIDEGDIVGVWTKTAEVVISIPASTTYNVNVRAYAGNAGTIWWDDIKLVQFDSVGFVDETGDENVALDIGTLVCHLVDFLQDTTFGKSDVNIATEAATVGQTVTKTYQFSDHVQFDQALEEYTERDGGDGGIDYAIEYDWIGGTRTFKNYAGKRGTDRSADISLTFPYAFDQVGGFGNVANYRFSKDGGNCITRQTVLGEDNGPDREEWIVVDTSLLDGLILEDVKQCPQNAEVRSIPGEATARIGLFRSPPVALEVDVVGNAIVGTDGIKLGYDLFGHDLAPGDLVAVGVVDGYVTIEQTMRVFKMKLDHRTLVTTVTLSVDGLS